MTRTAVSNLTTRRLRAIRIASLILSVALFVSLFVPWFHLPILGWSIPAPAWNRAGLFCLTVAGVLLVRALAGEQMRWLVRGSLLPALYYWWMSTESIKIWGATYLARTQLKMASANRALATLGLEGIDLYDPLLWRTLEPQIGWYVCGVSLFLALGVTAIDGSKKMDCPSCQITIREQDAFCHGCGHVLVVTPVCKNCAHHPVPSDIFCRACGTKL